MILLRKFIINTGDLLGRILPRVFLYKKSSKRSSLTIYNLHSTSEFLFPEYMSLLRQIQKNEEFINPENLEQFFQNEYKERSYSLLTLDDGFRNNFRFAEEVLDKLNIKAVFFIIPKFINKKGVDLNYKFFRVLYPNEKLISRQEILKNFEPLTLNQILKLNSSGHTIGMHGLNHENFGTLSEQQIKRCIEEGKNIFKKYKIQINHFAYPFGNNKSFTNKSNQILKKNFKYIHLGIRGSNYIEIDKCDAKILKRHPISNHGKDLRYFPVRYKEVKFFTSNRISNLINTLNKIKKK